MKVYQFLLCHNIHEGGWVTISLHRTKLGAYKALRKYLIEYYNDEYRDRMVFGKMNEYGAWKPFIDKRYRISVNELLD